MEPHAYYDAISKGYNELYGQEQTAKILALKNLLNVGSDDKVLDIGTGTGLIFGLMDADITGIEPSEKMLGFVHERYKGKVIKDFGENVAKHFEKGSFDCILSISTLHHINNIDKFFSALKALGKDDCKFGFSILKDGEEFVFLYRNIDEHFEILKERVVINDLILVCKK